jgi:hypothetical protein
VAVTEVEWLACTDPGVLLRRARFRSYRRKCRLFAVACCRRVWHLLVDERSRHAVAVAERHADGAATDGELLAASEAASEAHQEMFGMVGKVGASIEWAAEYAAHPNPFHGAKNVSWMAAWPRAYPVREFRPDDRQAPELIPCTVTRSSGGPGKWEVTPLKELVPTGAERPVQARLIRCIFGNPFHPVQLHPAWRTPQMVALAQAAYDHRELPAGTLDNTRLAVLADALEDAGCTNADLLGHLRGPGPHVRGCWAVDLLLGKG